MAQPPALVFIARHGTRLDAVSDSWHLSTPTPYDPPLTYGGWNQCRALGLRIATILHAREQASDASSDDVNGNSTQKKNSEGKKPRRHKVVIHTSPFLRCVQTSVAIAAGLAQFDPHKDGRPGTARPRTAGALHSASPRLRAMDGSASPKLAPIPEPTRKFAHTYARRLFDEQRRQCKPRLRIDAWLGEWLNPSYFEDITHPPTSPMLLAAAKGGLMRTENIEVYTPSASSKSSVSSLWSGTNGKSTNRENPLDDWTEVGDALPDGRHRLERSGSVSSVASSGRRSPFRPYGVPTITKTEPVVYVPPTPMYAVSTSDQIPRGYVSHARDGAVNVDYQWDSTRAPQEWGDGGEYGEEWSSMQKRFRRGLNHLMEWYSLHDPVDRGEDALGLDQADTRAEEDDQEDLVVILVTHGAGSNALIGALTGQPVLLDVGMASLTMAVRKENAPSLHPVTSPLTPPDGVGSGASDFQFYANRRRSSVDIGLSNIYEMKLVASSEHLRPGTDPTKLPPMMEAHVTDTLAKHKRFRSAAHIVTSNDIDSDRKREEPVRKNTSTAIGSIRRPSATSVPTRSYSNSGHHVSFSMDEVHLPSPMPQLTPGLWTPPSAQQPTYATTAEEEEEAHDFFSNFTNTVPQPGANSQLQSVLSSFQAPEPGSDPASPRTQAQQPQADSDTVPLTRSRSRSVDESSSSPRNTSTPPTPKPTDSVIMSGSGLDGALGYIANGYSNKTELPQSYGELPPSLRRGLSQKGLWGQSPSGTRVSRKFAEGPKRRWTLSGEN